MAQNFNKIEIDSGRVKLALFLQKNQLISIKNIRVETSAKGKDSSKVLISPLYLRRYLGLKKNGFYQEYKIKKIKTRLAALSFLNIKNEPYVIFEANEAEIILNLYPKNASKFDFLIGLQPNNNALPNAGRLFVTGNIALDLLNPFGYGERIAASWQQLRPSSPQLKLKTTLPGQSFPLHM